MGSIENEIEVQKLDASTIEFEKSTIMVVDDVEENRKLVQAVLKDYQIELIMAENGEEAIKKLHTVSIDLILMDLRMPKMNGYEATTIIKNDKKFKNIPIIALTASVMGKDLEKVSKYGFDGYLRKPVIVCDLIEEMGKYLKYHFKNEIIKDKKSEEKIDKDKLLFVIKLLENELKVEWLNIKDGGDFTLIEDFSIKLRELAQNNGIKILENYAEELIKNIEAFDIEKVDYMMNTFENLIKNLREKV